MNLRLSGESYEVRFVVDAYVSGCTRVRLFTAGNIPIANLSVNVDDENGENCFWLKDYAENEEIAGELLAGNYLEETGRSIRSGRMEIAEVRFTALGLAEAEDIRETPRRV